MTIKKTPYLVEFRRRHNLSQRELAQQIGISNGTLSRIECDIGYHSTKKVIQWCIRNRIDPVNIYCS